MGSDIVNGCRLRSSKEWKIFVVTSISSWTHMTNENRFIVYALMDPETGEIRYIGKSTRGLKRIFEHFRPSHLIARNHRTNWIKSVISRGVKPEFTILEVAENPESVVILEILAIAHYRSMGFNLVNATDGGEGVAGLVVSDETRKKISRARTGKKGTAHTEAHKLRMSKLRSGVKRSPETIKRISDGRKGKGTGPKSSEHINAIRRAWNDPKKKEEAAAYGRRAASVSGTGS